MRTLAVFHLKGGVGKTTTAVNIAALAAQDSIRTLLWDLDPQAGASWVLAAEATHKQNKLWQGELPVGKFVVSTQWPKLDVLAADLSLRKLQQTVTSKAKAEQLMRDWLNQLSESYGLIVIDCPPSLTPQMEGVLRAVDRIAVPVQPSLLSIRAYDDIRQHCAWSKNKQWLPFVSMIDKRKPGHVRWVQDEAKRYAELLPVVVAQSASAERMLEQRMPVVYSQPDVPLARNFAALWRAIKPRLLL